ncbi:hypothetical protein BaRGS_00019092 [Batillaria attramentaria]|uniref:Uncharacterized protein n=1 Tax=Batillaria attramentaria TaxID=370345 RepID=A0ABD0KRG7_9CAEN
MTATRGATKDAVTYHIAAHSSSWYFWEELGGRVPNRQHTDPIICPSLSPPGPRLDKTIQIFGDVPATKGDHRQRKLLARGSGEKNEISAHVKQTSRHPVNLGADKQMAELFEGD